MIRDLYVPSDIPSEDLFPRVPAAKKLEVIKNAKPVIREFLSRAIVTLPFGPRMAFAVHKNHQNNEKFIYLDDINVVDKELFGSGIGTRLVQAATRWVVEYNPDISRMETSPIRWGAVNTLVKVFGLESMAAEISGVRFGEGSDRPFEDVLLAQPPIYGRAYMMYDGVEAKIDRDVALTWEMPELNSSIANTSNVKIGTYK